MNKSISINLFAFAILTCCIMTAFFAGLMYLKSIEESDNAKFANLRDSDTTYLQRDTRLTIDTGDSIHVYKFQVQK